MPDRLALLGHGQVILTIGPVKLAAIGLPALVEEKLRQAQIAFVAGDAIQAYQADLDFLMPGHIAQLVRPENGVNQIGILYRDIEEAARAGRFISGRPPLRTCAPRCKVRD